MGTNLAKVWFAVTEKDSDEWLYPNDHVIRHLVEIVFSIFLLVLVTAASQYFLTVWFFIVAIYKLSLFFAPNKTDNLPDPTSFFCEG